MSAVEKEEVDGEIAPANLHRIFRADKTEVTAQFAKEIFQPGDEAKMKLCLGMRGGQLEKLDDVGILEYLGGFGMGLSQRSRDFWRREDGASEE